MLQSSHAPKLPTRQRGFVLIVALVLLLAMTLLGLAAIQGTSLQEKMAANARDQNLAFQSAEAALLAGMDGLASGKYSDNSLYAQNTNGLYLLSTCCNGQTYTSAWTVPDVWDTALSVHSALPWIPLLPSPIYAQPVFIIEELPPVVMPGGNLGQTGYGGGTPSSQPYRVTAYGYGGDSNTQAILQTIVTQ